jgi:hypothetical protein
VITMRAAKLLLLCSALAACRDIPAREPSLFDPPPQPPPSERRVVYSVFFNNDEYKGANQSVIIEACEAQAFTPIDLSPPPPPPKSSRKSKR